MRCLSETGLTGHSQELLLGAGPLDCRGVSQSSSFPLETGWLGTQAFAGRQTWVQISALPVCSTMTLGKSLPLFESQCAHLQCGRESALVR